MHTKSILSVAFLFCLLSCRMSEETRVKNACEQFIRGRIALDEGDSTVLKEVTEDSLFQLIMLNKKYEQMLHAPVIKPDLNIYPVSADVKDSSATCLMSGMEEYRIHLCKHGDDWKVKGENEVYPNAWRFASVKEKIQQQQKFNEEKPARDSVLMSVNTFVTAAKQYFYKPDPGLFSGTCSDATVRLIQRLFSYVKRKADPAILKEEMSKEIFGTGDVISGGGRATFKYYEEDVSLMLKLTNGKYVITGFNGRPSEYYTDEQIAAEYPDLLRAMKLVPPKQYRNKKL